MDIKVNDIQMPQEEYIEVKKLAYNYYEQYKNLTRREQEVFLNSMKELDTPIKTLILKNTLIFPDTKELLAMSSGRMGNYLQKLYPDEVSQNGSSIILKQVEYSVFGTQQLVADGILSVMEDKQYAPEDIGIGRYKELKEEALKCFKEFFELNLSQKTSFIQSCTDDWNYEDKIQLATLLLPNDIALMNEMEEYPLVKIASKYKLPIEILEFKKSEYELHNTRKIIETNGINYNFKNKPLGHDEMDNSAMGEIWDQTFYNDIKENFVYTINSKLSKMYGKEEVKRK